MPCCNRAAVLGLGLVLASVAPISAEDGWNPFKDRDQAPRASRNAPPPEPARTALPSMDGIGSKPWNNPEQFQRPAGGRQDEPSFGRDAPGPVTASPLSPPVGERARTVDRGELQPVIASDGSGLPMELWQGLDAKAVETLVGGLEVPPRSAAMHSLWKRIWSTQATPMQSGPGTAPFEALRIEALYRSGLTAELGERLKSGQAPADPLLAALVARTSIGIGDRETGCSLARSAVKNQTDLPVQIRGEILLLNGYCQAAAGDTTAAGLTVELARSETVSAPQALAVLDTLVAGEPVKVPSGKRLSLLDYRFFELAKAELPAQVLEQAEPALLVAIATGLAGEPSLKVAAAEAAARYNALTPDVLAGIYRAQSFGADELADPLAARNNPGLRRALLFKATEAERTPMKKTRLARALLDDARRTGLYMPVADMLAKSVEGLAPAQEISWFAETAIEINLAAGRYDKAKAWTASLQPSERVGPLQHWLVLIDLADPKWQGPRGENLVHAEQFALRGRMGGELLHRLATVLDALDYQIPIPLWEAASRTSQPSTGHLPETGVLTQLNDAAKKKEFARTILLTLKALGPTSAEGAHMIALGDAIRALRRAGLEPDARRLALEAVFVSWPRMANN